MQVVARAGIRGIQLTDVKELFAIKVELYKRITCKSFPIAAQREQFKEVPPGYCAAVWQLASHHSKWHNPYGALTCQRRCGRSTNARLCQRRCGRSCRCILQQRRCGRVSLCNKVGSGEVRKLGGSKRGQKRIGKSYPIDSLQILRYFPIALLNKRCNPHLSRLVRKMF